MSTQSQQATRNELQGFPLTDLLRLYVRAYPNMKVTDSVDNFSLLARWLSPIHLPTELASRNELFYSNQMYNIASILRCDVRAVYTGFKLLEFEEELDALYKSLYFSDRAEYYRRNKFLRMQILNEMKMP